ncbi:MAG: membrane protein insertase YidC [Candidatus Protistobacter heckmanni]|nr:membrane protein insertase YidC [Candidatus Protistobacter heckmanni]
MDIKRTLLWVVLTLSLVMLYENWQRAHGGGALFFPAPHTQSAPAAADPAKALGDVPKAAANAAPAAAAAPAGEAVVITTDLLRVQFDSTGATISELDLLAHHEKDGKPVKLFHRDREGVYLARSGLIGQGELPNHTVPFSVAPGNRSIGTAEQLEVRFEAEKNGVTLAKAYTFHRGSYVIDTRFEIANNGSAAISPLLYVELARDGSKVEASNFYSTFTGPVVYTDADKFQKVDFATIDKGKAKFDTSAAAGTPGWVGMVQHYFASAWILQDKAKRDIYLEKIDNNFYRVGMQVPLGQIEPGAKAAASARLFAGPQQEKMLEGIAPGLELVKDYGWLTIIAKPLFWLLEKLHGFIGNWGWSIIALTVLIKLVFFPLSAASYKSMAKMKDLQPRLTAMRERYKGDPQKMNQAMMEMYKVEKVNPLGGCFPILIQIPVFIALYWVLLATVEMRGAPWLGWIHDLSAPDPFYILPVSMAVSMFIQTKLNPTPPDPIQAKVMMIMPLAFSFMFFFFPAGLVLYWVVNNILSIAQQWQISRMHKAPAPAA